jgi:hypothetical protein
MKSNSVITIKESVLRKLLLSVTLLLIHFSITAQQRPSLLWKTIDESAARSSVSNQRDIIPRTYLTVELAEAPLKKFLQQLPMDKEVSPAHSAFLLSLPMPDGSYQEFKVSESPVMESALAAKYPEIKTYSGISTTDPSATVRFDWTDRGFHAMILGKDYTVFIDPYQREDTQHYIVYFKKDFIPSAVKQFQEGKPENEDGQKKPLELNQHRDGSLPSVMLSSGTVLRTYRLALAADGAYTQFQGGTKALALAAMVTSMNRVNGVYEKEVALHFNIIAGDDTLIYLNAATDPYTAGSACGLRPENQSNIDAVIGSAGYDIGHLFAMSAGGCATGNSVCNNSTKAYGVTGTGNPVGDPFDIDYVAHEMGHQLNAAHSWNGTQGSCTNDQYVSTAAYEPGSGSTIMCYAGICGSDDLQPHSDPYFHTYSFDQIVLYSTTGTGSTCGSTNNTGNNPPSVNAGSGGYTIPKGTPFTLTGSGSDPDGDALTYCWEEFDLGPAGPPNPPSGDGPLLRSFNPLSIPSRIFPKLSDILSNTSTIGEVLPNKTRAMNFRLTARDNRSGGGGVNYASVSFNVDGASGPFVVTSPNTAVSWCVGTQETITWDVANTNNAPVSAANVNILLSTDGGLTFPVTILSNTPNDGSQVITVPDNPVANNARIKVEAAGNIFFDISNANFTINKAPFMLTQPAGVAAQWGDAVSFTATAGGAPAPTVQWQLSTDGGSTFNNIGGATSTTLNLTCVTLAMNGYQYKAVFTNVCGSVTSSTATLTVTPKATFTSVTVVPNPQQYSDLVTITVKLYPASLCGETPATGAKIYIGTQLMGSVTFAANGDTAYGVLTNVALLEPSPFGTAPTGQMAPGNHTVLATITGKNSNFIVNDPTTILNILPEDARAYYTGACNVSTAGINTGAAVITLSATFKDITAVLGDPAYDPNAGDLRNATITFIDRDANVVIASNVPFGLVNPADPKIAVATYNWNVNIGAADSKIYTVGIIIGGYYTRNSSDDNTIITVSKPVPDFVTGGGYIVLATPGGLKAGDIGSKQNFGFTLKFNKKGTNLQGQLNSIVRRTEAGVMHTYQIKANKMTSLSVQKTAAGGTATFNGKAVLTDITNALSPVTVDANGSLQVKMADNGQPGTNDNIGITIWNKTGGLWYSSNWNSTATVNQLLAGGNLNINTSGSFRYEENSTSEFKVYPNPNHGQFTVEFQSENEQQLTLKVIDLSGRVIMEEGRSVSEGTNSMSFDVSRIAGGIYIISTTLDQQTLFTRMLIE